MVAGALDTILIPSLRLEEILADGSTLTNPAADSRRLFLGEDGYLWLKDSAGSVTAPVAAAAGMAADSLWDAKGDLAVGTGANTAQKLTAGANDLILMAASGETTGLKWAGGYTGWTPALTATSVNPTLGSGSSAAGRYLVLGDHVHAQGAIQFGAGGGAAAGTGSYNLSLPVNARTPVTLDGNLIGHGYIFDSNASLIRQVMLIYSAAGTVNIRMYDGTVVTNAAPWTWAASDALIFNYSYEAA